MGHPGMPLRYTYARSHMDKHKSSQLQPCRTDDNLNNALGAISVLGIEMIEDELKPYLNTILTTVRERKKGDAEQVVVSGILPILALSLRRKGPLTLPAAKLVAELAKESVVRKGFNEAGLVTALISVLTTADRELLFHIARAISRLSCDSSMLQEQLLCRGAAPRIAAVLHRFPDDGRLEAACLLALCNLGGMGEAEEAGLVWERGVSLRPGELVFTGASAARACGFVCAVRRVHVAQRAPGQCAVSVEVFQRCAPSFWDLHGSSRGTRRFPLPLPGLGSCTNLYKAIRCCATNAPRTTSLKTRVFHTFL